jgi:hypothetical protein
MNLHLHHCPCKKFDDWNIDIGSICLLGDESKKASQIIARQRIIKRLPKGNRIKVKTMADRYRSLSTS